LRLKLVVNVRQVFADPCREFLDGSNLIGCQGLCFDLRCDLFSFFLQTRDRTLQPRFSLDQDFLIKFAGHVQVDDSL
jgi:hypothetical protein